MFMITLKEVVTENNQMKIWKTPRLAASCAALSVGMRPAALETHARMSVQVMAQDLQSADA